MTTQGRAETNMEFRFVGPRSSHGGLCWKWMVVLMVVVVRDSSTLRPFGSRSNKLLPERYWRDNLSASALT
jgi:hypothetical protein